MPPDPTLVAVARSICDERELQLGAMVGEGAFKQTFRVETEDGDALALKVFRRSGSSPRTEREFQAMRRCEHPNIVSLLALDTAAVGEDSVVYCLEEFLPGGTLGARTGSAVLSRAEIVDLGESLIDALGHIASLSLVHRDIKPENILFRSDDTPVVVDFGIVRDLVRSPLTASWVLQGPGTPFFAAPEQLNNERALIDWRADQFSLGVTLFLSRFGFHPYGAPGSAPDEVIPAVSERRGITADADTCVDDDGLPVLRTMLQPWPVGRVRRPGELLELWTG